MSAKKKNKCEHKNRKGVTSNKINDTGNFLDVLCLDCGYSRLESRNEDGSVTTSVWYKKRS